MMNNNLREISVGIQKSTLNDSVFGLGHPLNGTVSNGYDFQWVGYAHKNIQLLKKIVDESSCGYSQETGDARITHIGRMIYAPEYLLDELKEIHKKVSGLMYTGPIVWMPLKQCIGCDYGFYVVVEESKGLVDNTYADISGNNLKNIREFHNEYSTVLELCNKYKLGFNDGIFISGKAGQLESMYLIYNDLMYFKFDDLKFEPVVFNMHTASDDDINELYYISISNKNDNRFEKARKCIYTTKEDNEALIDNLVSEYKLKHFADDRVILSDTGCITKVYDILTEHMETFVGSVWLDNRKCYDYIAYDCERSGYKTNLFY